jgi:hypothetical protein
LIFLFINLTFLFKWFRTFVLRTDNLSEDKMSADPQHIASSEEGPAARGGGQRLLALYLGAVTAVIGPGGITIHRHTRGTVDLAKPIFGIGRTCSDRSA